ncbi:MAG TPA: hypothetical protein PLE12_02875 [Propionicimonas sp.]|nr:hypothetical protein [Propionicimonas sp.]
MTAPAPAALTPAIHRGVALFCLGALVPAVTMGIDQVPSLATWWLVVFGAGIVVVTVAMTVVSLAGYPIEALAAGWVSLVLAGLATWPLAWTSPEPARSSPWLWMCLGAASVWVALLLGTRWGFLCSLFTGAGFALVRISHSGGAITLLQAMQDMLVLVVTPWAVIIGISLLTDAIRDLDASLTGWQQQQARAAVEEALVEARRRLDGLVHDEVMTTLVSVAQAGGQRDQHVTELARHAIDRLQSAGEAPDDGAPVTAEHLSWLVEDVVTSVCPEAHVTVNLGDPMLSVPPEVAGAFARASREVALNVVRHAGDCRVEVVIGDPPGRRRGLQVVVRDDGVGFDLTGVPGDRFGLRRSVRGRMEAVEGEMEVRSRPGHGTTVVLSWAARAEPKTARQGGPRSYPKLSTVSPAALAGLIWVLVGLHFVLGWTSLDQVSSPWPVLAAQVLATIATWLSLRGLTHSRIPASWAAAVVLLLLGTTLFVQSVLPQGQWPGYATWHSSVVMALMIVLLFRGRAKIAWLGVLAFALVSLVWAATHGLGLGELVRVLFGPVSWMVVAQLASGWLLELEHRQRRARLASQGANRAIAQSYSRLVMRDVWLRQLKQQAGPLLATLADGDSELSPAEAEAAVALERRLRDGLRAANLLTEGTQDVVEAARGRGIEVSLVDSRGSALPEPVKLAIRDELRHLAEDRSIRRLVVRAAPEGYPAVATILVSRTDATSDLLNLDADGRLATR